MKKLLFEYFPAFERFWFLASPLLILAVVIVSLAVSRRRYLMAFIGFALLFIGTGSLAVFKVCASIGIADAFGTRGTSLMAYGWPIFIAFVFIYPVFALSPLHPAVLGRKIVLGLASVAIVGSAFRVGAIASQGVLSVLILFPLLLWLRVYDLRIATEAK